MQTQCFNERSKHNCNENQKEITQIIGGNNFRFDFLYASYKDRGLSFQEKTEQ
jgi:hypothetical protein